MKYLCKAPSDLSLIVKQAEELAAICDREYRALTKKPNIYATSKRENKVKHIPIFCVTREDDYWCLVCNDSEVPESLKEAMYQRMRDKS